MAKQLFTNNASGTLNGTLAIGGTTLTLSAGDGNKFPTPIGGDYFLLTLFEKDVSSVEVNYEIVKVTSRISDTLTIVRDFEGVVGVVGGRAYPSGVGVTVHAELRHTAYAAANVLTPDDNLAGITTTATARANLGLGNIDNTSDANKPVSTAQATAIGLKQSTSEKDTANGYAGLSLFKLNLRNAADTWTSFLTNTATAVRTWTMPDKDGTVAMLSDITGTNSGTNTGDETTSTIKSKLSITTLSGSNTGDQTSIVGITGTIAQFNTAITDGDLATGGGTAVGTNTGDETGAGIRTKLGITTLSGSNTGDQTSVTGNAGTVTNGVYTTDKDATGGIAGLTLLKINFKNAANTFTSFFTNSNTAARTYTFPDKDGTVAMTSDITGTNSGTNTGDQSIFSTIAVSGQSNVVADTTSDTLTLVAGSNVTITTNAATDEITIAAASGGGSSTLTIDAITGTYTVIAGDLGKVINCTSGTFTVSLTAAATLGIGFNCWVWNTGTGVITINPSGTEIVDGVDPTTKFTLSQGTGIRLICNGTGWLTTDVRQSGDASIGILGTQIGRNGSGQMSVAKTGGGATALNGSYASGYDSFAASVGNNTSAYGAQGSASISIGGYSKVTSAAGIALGFSSTVTAASYGVALGYTCAVYGNCGLSAGYQAITTGVNSVSIGSNTRAEGERSFACGNRSLAQFSGKYAFSSGQWAALGDAQYGKLTLRTVSNAGGLENILTNGIDSLAGGQLMIYTAGQAYAFTGLLIGKEAGTANIAAYKVEGTLVRNGTTVTMPTGTLTPIGTPSITLTVSPTLSADNATKALTVTSGYGANAILWVCYLDTAEVTYA